MKNFLSIVIITLCFTLILTGCQNNNSKVSLTDKPNELLKDIINKASEYDNDSEYGLATIKVEEHTITKDESTDVLGLTEDEYDKYIESALESKVLDSWMNHSIVVAKLKDEINVKDVALKIVKNTSPSRFGCLKVSKIEGAYYGNYVIFAASDGTIVDNVIKAFNEITNKNAKIITRENNWDTNMFDE